MNGQNNHEEEQKTLTQKVAERRLKKKVGKLVGKALKVAAKLALQAIKVAFSLLIKGLLWIIGTIGLPMILKGIFLSVIVVLMFLLVSLLWGGISTSEDHDEEDEELRQYIIEASNSSVDEEREEQQPYKVPEPLISSAIQITAQSEEHEDLDNFDIVDMMAGELRPTFEYETYNEYTETQVIVDDEEHGVTKGDIEREDNEVDKLSYVSAWNGNTTIEYEEHLSDWYIEEDISTRETTETQTVTRERDIEESVVDDREMIDVDEDGQKQETEEYEVDIEVDVEYEVKTTTKTRYNSAVIQSRDFTDDYTHLDQALNSVGYEQMDKELVHAFYEVTNEERGNDYPTMRYTEWLENSGYVGHSFSGEIIAGGGVPQEFIPYYQDAEERFGVSWYTLAAIHRVETVFSTIDPMISEVGAIGHLQFMPRTWIGWGYDVGASGDLGDADIPEHILTDLSMINQYRGLGVDGNGDGKADPWNIEDAIHSAAHLLSDAGYGTNRFHAIRSYNHADWYVEKVKEFAELYKLAATYIPTGDNAPPISDGAFTYPTSGSITSQYGPRRGRLHAGVDIGLGGRVDVPIIAAADGTVVQSHATNEGKSYGEMVVIQHQIEGTNFQTLYGHMIRGSRMVSVGQEVSKGTLLGYMGNTGNSTGPHLHFEIHEGTGYAWNHNNDSINPLFYLPPTSSDQGRFGHGIWGVR